MKPFLLICVLTIITSCASAAPKHNVTIVHTVNDNSAADASSVRGAVINTTNPVLREEMERGAIEGPNGIYFMPIGKDSTGCQYYTSFAPGKVTLTAVFYRRADGSFTNSRTDAKCD